MKYALPSGNKWNSNFYYTIPHLRFLESTAVTTHRILPLNPFQWKRRCTKHGTILIHLPSQSLTWNLKMMVSKRNLLFQVVIFRFHVKLWEGKLQRFGTQQSNCWICQQVSFGWGKDGRFPILCFFLGGRWFSSGFKGIQMTSHSALKFYKLNSGISRF